MWCSQVLKIEQSWKGFGAAGETVGDETAVQANASKLKLMWAKSYNKQDSQKVWALSACFFLFPVLWSQPISRKAARAEKEAVRIYKPYKQA